MSDSTLAVQNNQSVEPGLINGEKLRISSKVLEGELIGSADIPRGETQKGVNRAILSNLNAVLDKNKPVRIIDMPCGKLTFLNHLKKLLPLAELHGVDIVDHNESNGIHYKKMNLMKDFTIPEETKFDVITSISGIMMFGNTHNFISNCVEKLKKGGILIVTNDNASSISDRISQLFLGRNLTFKPLYENDEGLTQNIPVQEIVRLLRINGIEIEKIEYTSQYLKDLILLPIALLVYPFQWFYINRYKSDLPVKLKFQMYSFAQLLNRHYIIYGRKPL